MKIGEILHDGDVLETGEVRLTTLARRLRVQYATLKTWCEGWRGFGVGRGKKRRIVFLRCVAYGRELRTRPEWYQQFFDQTQRRK